MTGRSTVARMVMRWSRKGLSKEVSSRSVRGREGWMYWAAHLGQGSGVGEEETNHTCRPLRDTS